MNKQEKKKLPKELRVLRAKIEGLKKRHHKLRAALREGATTPSKQARIIREADQVWEKIAEILVFISTIEEN